MNKSKIANILHLFGLYQPYVVEDNVRPDVVNVANVRNEASNEVVYLGWDNSEGLECCIKFTEEGLSEARVADGNLVMEDDEGYEITIAFMESRKYSLVAEDID
jgi:hypothetical protein